MTPTHLAAFVCVVGLMASPTLVAAPANANGCITVGTGTSGDPYIIANSANLQCLRTNSSDYWGPGLYFLQTADIDIGGTDWGLGIGNLGRPFEGVYDGGGFQISGLSATRTTAEGVGLFGATNGATIRNTNISGSIVGAVIGGLIGYAENTTVTASTAGVTITSSGSLQPYVGGLIGHAVNVSVSNSSASGSIGQTSRGQIVSAGGLIGYADNTTVTQSRATGAIAGQIRIGGLIGLMGAGNLSKSFATGVVTGDEKVGGLIGELARGATVGDVYARGAATVLTDEGGGLLGSLDSDGGTVELARVYSTGRATGPGSAGFIGVAAGASTLTASFWDTQTSGQASAVFDGVVTGVTGLTTAALTDIATYRAAGWNIGGWAATGTTWGICSGVNDGYPYLQAFYASNPCDDGPTPPPWHQAYARASGDTCVEGWNPSWAEWPNGNTGGFVCARTLVYNRSTGRWDVHK